MKLSAGTNKTEISKLSNIILLNKSHVAQNMQRAM